VFQDNGYVEDSLIRVIIFDAIIRRWHFSLSTDEQCVAVLWQLWEIVSIGFVLITYDTSVLGVNFDLPRNMTFPDGWCSRLRRCVQQVS